MTDPEWPPLCVVLLTYDRLETAEPTLRAILERMHYPGALDVHIADDGSPTGYVDRLVEIAGGFGHVRHVGRSNAGGRGYGASYNLATQLVHLSAEIIVPLEDDWLLTRELDARPLVATLLDPEIPIECIRLGYVGWTQALRGEFVRTPAGQMLIFDPQSPERHVFAGHARIETRRFERSVGPWPEGLAAGMTEFTVSGWPESREGVAFPLDLVRPCGDLFVHTGAKELGEIEPRVGVSP